MRNRIRPIIISAALTLFSAASFASTIQLSGVLNPNDTAVVSNPLLSGSVYTFTIQNTASVGVITNLGLGFGDTLRLSSFTTSSAFQYTIKNNVFVPDFDRTLDFAMVGADQTMGIAPGQSESYTWMLTLADGTPVSGISAMDIAQHQVVRFRLLPTATGTDLALGAQVVPEPSTGGIVGVSLLAMLLGWRRVKSRAV
jgi:hypothetical protein